MTLFNLPDLLAERCRALNDAEPASAGSFVLYWMRTACRAHENPALDVALIVGRALGKPVFVYHALAETYPHASDRHHTFILEGARDVQAAMAARGIGYAFHLERPGHRGRHLVTLAEKAALVVTEDMPVDPLRAWTTRLANAVSTPVWAVDTACVVPMRLVERAYDRAFAFRRATEPLRRERLSRPWWDVEAEGAAFLPDDLPFEPLNLQSASIPDLVAACAIDHSIGPVPHTKGGSSAGYERWSTFRDQRLQRYAQHRNDALRADAVSRMSAYLHHGQVSPFRLAREAAEIGGKGAEKFLDELLVWRELGYAWCFHRPDHDQLSALPDWALESLRDHRDDLRPAKFSWETLARGRTGQALWDAAQGSLLIHGELHNNVRMTWGKALLTWTDGPEDCWSKLVDLNHRYALDGRDPNSYGGLMWCLGLFDRPFDPSRAIAGHIRPRPLEVHARRLDVDAYARQTSRPALSRPPKVGVVGAGIAGLTCARILADHSLDVTLFDKGRAPGGRTSRRRADPFQFDHGAQYFTARDPVFRRHVDSWREDGVIDVWRGRTVGIDRNGIDEVAVSDERFVGAPGMNALAKHLAKDLTVRVGVEIRNLARDGETWRLGSNHAAGDERFDLIVLAVPAPQASSLLGTASPFAGRLKDVGMSPCWAVLLGFDEPLDLPFDAASVKDSPIARLARNNSKPERGEAESWVLHAAPDWSKANLEDEPDAILPRLQEAFGALTGMSATPAYRTAHRWRYALAHRPLGEACLLDEDQRLGVCGDWCLAGRLEAAFQSGAALAGRILSRES